MNDRHMNSRPSRLMAAASLGVSAILAGLVFAAVAQDDGADGSPGISRSLLPALMTPGAEKGMLLGIAHAGDSLVAVGGNGVIVTTRDGDAWTQMASPVDVALTNVAFADDQHGWAVGHDAIVLGTVDGGRSWAVQNFQPELSSPLFGIQPLSADSAIAVGAFGLLKRTDDGGLSWRDVESPEVKAEMYHLNALTRVASGKLVIVGEQGLAAVSDDGRQWRRHDVPYEGSLFGVEPWGDRGAIAFGMRGNVFVTADVDTEDWRPLPVNSSASFFGGQVLRDGKVILTGAEDQLLLLEADGSSKALSDSSRVEGQKGTLTGSALLGDRLVLIGESGARKAPEQPL